MFMWIWNYFNSPAINPNCLLMLKCIYFNTEKGFVMDRNFPSLHLCIRLVYGWRLYMEMHFFLSSLFFLLISFFHILSGICPIWIPLIPATCSGSPCGGGSWHPDILTVVRPVRLVSSNRWPLTAQGRFTHLCFLCLFLCLFLCWTSNFFVWSAEPQPFSFCANLCISFLNGWCSKGFRLWQDIMNDDSNR